MESNIEEYATIAQTIFRRKAGKKSMKIVKMLLHKKSDKDEIDEKKYKRYNLVEKKVKEAISDLEDKKKDCKDEECKTEINKKISTLKHKLAKYRTEFRINN